MNRTSFPPGTYYIGDLCYAIEDWDAFCKLTIKGNECIYGEFPWKTGKMWLHGTAYGDGCFADQEGNEYGVDAGLIGVLPIELVDKHEYELAELGNVVDFPGGFECSYDDGIFYIGHLRIDTDPGKREEEDVDYSDDEDIDEYGNRIRNLKIGTWLRTEYPRSDL